MRTLFIVGSACLCVVSCAGAPPEDIVDAGDVADASVVDASAPDASSPDAGAVDSGVPNIRPVVSSELSGEVFHGVVNVLLRIVDAEEDPVSLIVTWAKEGSTDFKPITLSHTSPPLDAVASSASGRAFNLQWNSVGDLGKKGFSLVLRVAVSDAGGPGNTVEIGPIAVVNAVHFRSQPMANDLSVNHAAAGDIDGDGDADLVLATSAGAVLMLNDGSGSFLAAPSTSFPQATFGVSHVALADVNGDRRLDVVVGVRSGNGGSRRNRLYLGDGRGHFLDGTATYLPDADDQTERVLVGDLDGDDHPDLVFLNSGSQQDELLLNSGNGRFTDATAGHLPVDTLMAAGGVLVDFDSDDDLDLVIVNFISSQGFRLYQNDGHAVFTDKTADFMPSQRTSGILMDVVAGDWDSDGDPDLYLVDTAAEGIVLDNDHGRYKAIPTPGVGGLATSACVGDVNLDRRPDVLVSRTSSPAVLLMNSATGFAAAASSNFSDEPAPHRGCTSFDADGDGDPDFFVAVEHTAASQLWVNEESR